MISLNSTVLMSGADYFSDEFAINPYMDASILIDTQKALAEHQTIQDALTTLGVRVIKTPAPINCQDGVYTANWALIRGQKAVCSSLPEARKAEEAYAQQVLCDLGKEIILAPYRFSGQGDALPCGNLLFMGTSYRTDPRMHGFIAETLGYQVVSLQTIPKLDSDGSPVMNAVTGWSDSFFYDIDLALAVLRDDLIAWCPEAFVPDSQNKIRALPIDKIEVALDEAVQGFACNLISTGSAVVMSSRAPKLAQEIRSQGLEVVTPEVSELGKGGGYIRCTTLTLT